MSAQGDNYLFDRDSVESKRLDDQHEHYNKTLEYLLHPSITKSLPTSPLIADLACGTGIITRQLTTEYPSATLHAFDISPGQFPADLSSLPNATFHIGNVKEVPPEHFHGQFDVVYIRHLITIMEPSDWAIVAARASLLLKPGGYIQWVEGTYFSLLPVLRGDSKSKTANLQATIEKLNEVLDFHRKRWDYAGLVPIFEELGLEAVEQDVVSSDRIPGTRAATALNPVLAGCGAARMTGRFSEEEVRGMEREARKDIETGAYLRWDIYVTVGRKPGSG